MASALWKQNLSEDQGWDSLANSAAFYSAVLTTMRAMLWACVRAERSCCKPLLQAVVAKKLRSSPAKAAL